MDLLAIAIAPGIAICLFIFHRDAFNKEPKLTLIVSFFLGMATILPAIVIERQFFYSVDNSVAGIFVKAFFIVALTEELVKYAALRIYGYTSPSFDEPLDGIVYSVMVSMGFATLENILYVQQYGMTVGIQRMFLAVPAHATFGVVMGYFVGKAKFAPVAQRTKLHLTGLLFAVFFHGAYDFFLFLGDSPDFSSALSQKLLIVGAVVSLIVAAILSFKHIAIHRQLSRQTNGDKQPIPQGILLTSNPSLQLRLASPADIPLIQELAQMVWPQTYRAILTPAQIDYMMYMSNSVSALADQMKNGHFFFIVHQHKDAVGFASISCVAPQQYRLHKIYVLSSEQGKGTGRLVMESLMQYLRAAGGKMLELNVNRNNRARTFYEKAGFTVIREEDINIGQGFFMNDYVMQRPL